MRRNNDQTNCSRTVPTKPTFTPVVVPPRPVSMTPAIPEKKYRIVNGRVTSLVGFMTPPTPRQDNSDDEVIPENEALSKPKHISQECLAVIDQVHRSLSHLLVFQEYLEKHFASDPEVCQRISLVFSDVGLLKVAYDLIVKAVAGLRVAGGVPGPSEVLLKPEVRGALKAYRPFLMGYAKHTRFLGDLGKSDPRYGEACGMAKKRLGLPETTGIDGCLYTAFSSLFSLELILDRYRKCFPEGSPSHQRAVEAKTMISCLLTSADASQDQADFLQTQKELNLLTGRTREPKMNSRFVMKVVATKFARRDDKALLRQLVLFTDCLYVTTLPGSLIVTCSVRQELSLGNMRMDVIPERQTLDGDLLRWGLCIRAREAIQDFFFDSEKSLSAWKAKLQKAIDGEGSFHQPEGAETAGDELLFLGKEAPRWQKDAAAGYCNGRGCNLRFSAAARRHHCRADGLLYCDTCCSFKIKLDFETSSADSRVCELCYNILFLYVKNQKQLQSSRAQLAAVLSKKTRVGTRIGWLLVRPFSKEKNIFLAKTNYFCELDLHDPMMRLFERQEDKMYARTIMLVEKAVVTGGSRLAKALSDSQFVIEDQDGNEAYLVKAASPEDCERWVNCLRERISASCDS